LATKWNAHIVQLNYLLLYTSLWLWSSFNVFICFGISVCTKLLWEKGSARTRDVDQIQMYCWQNYLGTEECMILLRLHTHMPIKNRFKQSFSTSWGLYVTYFKQYLITVMNYNLNFMLNKIYIG